MQHRTETNHTKSETKNKEEEPSEETVWEVTGAPQTPRIGRKWCPPDTSDMFGRLGALRMKRRRAERRSNMGTNRSGHFDVLKHMCVLSPARTPPDPQI